MKSFGIILPLVLLLLTSCKEESPTSNDTELDESTDLIYAPTDEFDLSADGYTSVNISGFQILVEDKAKKSSLTATNKALSILGKSLSEIKQLTINEEIKATLLEVPIFVDLATEENRAAVYHPGREWLIENGYPEQKEGAIEISNITNFISWTEQNQPYMVLHELAHAYHHRIFNFNNEDIDNAYENALQNGLYLSIGYHEGGGEYTTRARAYGLNNEKEFFAEATEAYFGTNDFYPYERNDLQSYDSVSYKMIKTVWEQN
ncbi:MAG: hypothetical protein BalsKO_26590 [Balneolaceae bacterium]